MDDFLIALGRTPHKHRGEQSVVVYPAWTDSAPAVVIGGKSHTLAQFAAAFGVDLKELRGKSDVADRPYTVADWFRQRGVPTVNAGAAPIEILDYYAKSGKRSPKFRRIRFRYDNGTLAERIVDVTTGGKPTWAKRKAGYVTGTYTKGEIPAFTYQQPQTEPLAPGTLWICEGPPDQVMLAQWGFTAVAVPSTSFGERGFIDFIGRTLGKWFAHCKRWVFCFDAGSAGDDATVRGLNSAAAFCLEHEIEIGQLAWPEGTGDGTDVTDLALKHGKLFPNVLLNLAIDPIVAKASEPVEPEQAKSESADLVWMDEDRRLARTPTGYVKRSTIHKKDGSDVVVDERISNCVLDVVRFYRDNDNIASVRAEIVMNGKRWPATIPTEAFADAASFRKLIQAFGVSNFAGATSRILPQILTFESREAVKSEIRVADFLGWTGWGYIVGDGIVRNGTFYPADDEGVVDVEGERWEITSQQQDNEFYGGKRPCFRDAEFDEERAREAAEHAATIVGDGFAGWLVLGWCIAAFYRDAVFDRNRPNLSRAFPYLSLLGNKESGKTETVRRFMAIFGLPLIEGNNWSTSTPFFLEQNFYKNSNVPPVWLEECSRAEKKATWWGLLKSAFNGASGGRGVVANRRLGTHRTTVRGTLVTTGEEELPELAGRAVLVDMPHQSERTQANKRAFDWMGSNADALTAVGRRVMERRSEDPKAAAHHFIDRVAYWYQTFEGLGKNQSTRRTQNIATILAGLDMYPVKLQLEGEFIEWVFRYAESLEKDQRGSDVVAEGLHMYLGQPGHYAFLKKTQNGRRILGIPSAHMEAYLRRTQGIEIGQFVQALRKSPCNYAAKAKGTTTAVMKVPRVDGRPIYDWSPEGGVPTRCWILEYDSPHLPDVARFQSVVEWTSVTGESGRWAFVEDDDAD